MKTWISAVTTALAVAAGAAAATAASTTALPVRVDPRVELVGVVCRLAGYDEWREATVATYDAASKRWFEPHREHEAVKLAAELRRTRGIAFNAPVALALTLDPVTFAPRVPLRPRPETLDGRWDPASAERFAAALARFAADSRFADFLAEQAPEIARAESAFAVALGEGLEPEWFRRALGFGARVSLVITPALLSRHANYGCSVVLPDGSFEAYQVIATPASHDASRLDVPTDALCGLVAHEMSHPFVNPWVDAHRRELLPAGRVLYDATQETMKRNAYGNVETLLYESVVRATAIRWAREHGRGALVRAQIAEDRRKAFRWTGELADTLAACGTLDAAAAPRVAACLARWGRDGGAILAADAAAEAAADSIARAAGPQVVRLEPAEGAVVAAGDGALVIAFDRPMAGGMSVMGDVPEVTGKPVWNAERTVLTVPVRFAAGRTYHLGLNSPTNHGFVSAAGEALAPREWAFSVR